MFGQLMEARDGNRNFMFSYALCCRKLGENDEAKKMLFRITYEHPDDREASIMLASMLLLDGKIEDAFRRVEKMSDEDLDDDARMELVVVRTLCLLALNRRDEAVRCYAHSIGQLNDYSNPYHKVNEDITENFAEYHHQLELLGLDGQPLSLFTHEVYKQVKARG